MTQPPAPFKIGDHVRIKPNGTHTSSHNGSSYDDLTLGRTYIVEAVNWFPNIKTHAVYVIDDNGLRSDYYPEIFELVNRIDYLSITKSICGG